MNSKSTSLNLKNIESFVESPIEPEAKPVAPKTVEKRPVSPVQKRPLTPKPVFNKFLKEDAPANKNFESIMFKNTDKPKKCLPQRLMKVALI